MEKYDEVNHPKHYVENRFYIEPHQVLRGLPYPHGNALKYILRAGKKPIQGKTLEESKLIDLKKALWYLKDRGIDFVSNDLLVCLCESGINEIISRAYYPDIEFSEDDPHGDPGDKPKTFWQNLETIVEYEINSLEKGK